MKVTVTRIAENYGAGNPGYNVFVSFDLGDERIGQMSWPNVEGSVKSGICRLINISLLRKTGFYKRLVKEGAFEISAAELDETLKPCANPCEIRIREDLCPGLNKISQKKNDTDLVLKELEGVEARMTVDYEVSEKGGGWAYVLAVPIRGDGEELICRKAYAFRRAHLVNIRAESREHKPDRLVHEKDMTWEKAIALSKQYDAEMAT